MLSKRNQEKRIYQKGKQKGILQNVEVMEEIQQLDNKDYMDELNLYKDVLYKNSCNNFKIIMWEKIPYVVPIATQTLVALPKDTEGIEINNIYDMAGNVYDWSISTYNARYRVISGGAYNVKGIASPSYHNKDFGTPTTSTYVSGFRSTLYINL